LKDIVIFYNLILI